MQTCFLSPRHCQCAGSSSSLFFFLYSLLVGYFIFFIGRLAKLRVNRLSRANLYLLYSFWDYSSSLLYCSFISNEPNKRVVVVYRREKHDGARKANCIRVSFYFYTFPYFYGSRLRSERLDDSWQTSAPKTGFTPRHSPASRSLLCVSEFSIVTLTGSIAWWMNVFWQIGESGTRYFFFCISRRALH